MLLNPLATRSRLDEDDAKMQEGTVGYLRKSEPRYLAFLARGCDTLEVELALGYLGLDLYDALRHAGGSGRAMATRHEFPAAMKNRIAYALAAFAHGARDDAHMPDWSLGVADFPKTTQEKFDA